MFVQDGDVGPGGTGFWHPVANDTPANASVRPQRVGARDNLPDGARLISTDFGAPGRVGPCPPKAYGPYQ